jgi:hypothetical protein
MVQQVEMVESHWVLVAANECAHAAGAS